MGGLLAGCYFEEVRWPVTTQTKWSAPPLCIPASSHETECTLHAHILTRSWDISVRNVYGQDPSLPVGEILEDGHTISLRVLVSAFKVAMPGITRKMIASR